MPTCNTEICVSLGALLMPRALRAVGGGESPAPLVSVRCVVGCCRGAAEHRSAQVSAGQEDLSLSQSKILILNCNALFC